MEFFYILNINQYKYNFLHDFRTDKKNKIH